MEERTFTVTARRAQIVQAAIDTIAEVGYAKASLDRIGARIGISKGLIGYHFAGKDQLIKQLVEDVVAEGMAYMQPRILAETTGPGRLRAYIESNLDFLREHRNAAMAIVEIARNDVRDVRRQYYGNSHVDQAVQKLRELLADSQSAGELRADFDAKAMAVAIRAAIDAASPRMLLEPDFDIDGYGREVANAFDLATRITDDRTDTLRRPGS
jgi:TetR/AcrR family fatty acid metabolism transcriptional regulator